MQKPSSPFLASVFEFMVVRHYAKSTIEAYIYWIRWFIRFHRNQHPAQMGNIEVEQFLSFLANERSVAVKTQSLALNALVFLYKEITYRVNSCRNSGLTLSITSSFAFTSSTYVWQWIAFDGGNATAHTGY